MLSWRFKYSLLSAFLVCPTETYKTYKNRFSSLILKDQNAFSLLQCFSECSCLSSTKRFQSIQRKAYVWLWDKYTWTSCVVCVLVPSHIWNSKESKFKNITALRFIFDRLFPTCPSNLAYPWTWFGPRNCQTTPGPFGILLQTDSFYCRVYLTI